MVALGIVVRVRLSSQIKGLLSVRIRYALKVIFEEMVWATLV